MIRRIFLFVYVFLLLSSCNNSSNPVSSQTLSSTVEENQKQTLLPEPVIVDDNPKFKLTELKLATQQFFTIHDKIVFADLDPKLKDQELKRIILSIKSHCLVGVGGSHAEKEVIIQEFSRPLSRSIPILEILPPQLLFIDNNDKLSLSSCSFSFKAKDTVSQAEHHFEVPHLPIKDLDSPHFINLVNPALSDDTSAVTNKFPYVFVDKPVEVDVTEYVTRNKAINSLQLKCSAYTVNQSLVEDGSIPLSLFFKNSQSNEVTMAIKNKPVQKCRIFGYNKNTVVAASLMFDLVYPELSPPVTAIQSKWDSSFYMFKSQVLNNLYNRFWVLSDNQPQANPIIFYDYTIKNPYSYPISVKLDNYYSGIKTALYAVYFNYQTQKTFYNSYSVTMKFGNINRLEGQYLAQNKDGELFLTLYPKSKVSVPLMVDKSPAFCKKVLVIGFVTKVPDITVTQVISNEEKVISHKENMLYAVSVNPAESHDVLFQNPLFPKKMGPRMGADIKYHFGHHYSCFRRKSPGVDGDYFQYPIMSVKFATGSLNKGHEYELLTLMEWQEPKTLHVKRFFHDDNLIGLALQFGFHRASFHPKHLPFDRR